MRKEIIINRVSFRILAKGVKMRCNEILGGQSGMILLEAKHMAN